VLFVAHSPGICADADSGQAISVLLTILDPKASVLVMPNGNTLVNHVGITVTDLDASTAFYRDIVGFDLLRRAGQPTQAAWFDRLTSNPGAIVNSAILGKAGFMLQLVQYDGSSAPAAVIGHNRGGSPHFCINVDNVEEKREQLVADGRYRVGPLVELPFPDVRSFYVLDPDGVPVEFLYLPGPIGVEFLTGEKASAKA
jgi:catechol 2,3-dioxygenase-like lactoylglutathione lyase family enzyme